MKWRRLSGVMAVAATGFAVGCSNAPLAGTMDLLFPSRLHSRPDTPSRPPDDLIRPPDLNLDRDRAPLPPPNLRDLRGPAETGRLEGLPRIGEPLPGDDTLRGRTDVPSGGDRMPLPAPNFPRDRN